MYEQGRYAGQGRDSIKQDLQGQGYAPLLITETPDTHLEAHSHSQSHILVVVEGEMRLELEGANITMKPGDKVTIKPHQTHVAYFGRAGCKYFWIEY